MATAVLSPDIKEKERTNFYKVIYTIQALKRGICPFIQNEVDLLHTSLKLKIHGVQTTLPEPCTVCNFGFVHWNDVTSDWDLPVRGQCKSSCVLWFHELLECHVNQKSKKIYWENCDIPQWPLKPWECAKVFMPKGQIPSSAGPADCTLKALLLLLRNCEYFRRKLSPPGHGLLPKIYATVKNIMYCNEQLPDRDTEKIIQQIIQLLEDPISLKTREECQTEVAYIRKVSKADFLVLSPDVHSMWQELRPLKAVNASELTCEGRNTNNECGDNQMIGAGNATNVPRNSKQSQDLSGCKEGIAGHDPFSTAKTINLGIPHNPRCGQIIRWPVEEMEKRIGKEIGTGAFGIVYKAILRPEDSKMLDGNERKFVIKRIMINEEEFQKSYEKEICYGRILHPFINPIIARAESLPDLSKQGFSYLMMPYMKNKDLRSNIDKENKGLKLSDIKEENKGQHLSKEPNYSIWTRCTYQIAQAVDYLHRDLTPVRGSIFHRDLTSNNILLDEHFNIRIGDFGIAVEAKLNATKATLTSTIGTKGYHPLVMDEKYVASYDIFSVGVVILEMLTGQKPEKDEESKYLFQRFSTKKELDHHLTIRARKNIVSMWGALEHRNKIAEIALAAVSLGRADRKAVNLLQELEKLRLSSRDCYRSPEPNDFDTCVSCCVNRTVKLPLKGKNCLGNEKTNPCQPFCLHCLMNHHINPLVCPKHGKSRPPFGDNVYGVFVAGNQADGMIQVAGGNKEDRKAAKIFIADVEKFAEALTAKHFFESGSSKNHFKIVKPDCPGSKEKMMTRIEEAFTDVKSIIERALEENNIEPENRLPSSLFIFYFSGHCTSQNGLYLGNAEETISTSTPWIMDMLHVKLRVEQVLVVLDCCHANSQNFVHSENPAHKNQNVRIVQSSSCDTNEKAQAQLKLKAQAQLQYKGSTYTHFFCQGLQASRNPIKLCAICREENRKNGDISVPCTWYHTECSKDQTVTLKRLIQYIKEHFNLLRDYKYHPVDMTPIQNAKGEVDIYLGYYNPSQPHIPINLSGSQGKNHFQLRKPYPEKMDLIKKDIIKYIVTEDVPCDVLSFHQSYGQNCDDTSCLVGIYPKRGSKKNMELISLDSIYMSWASGLQLEARVRENMKELTNGPVKLNKITKKMFENLKRIDTSSLKVSSDIIQILLKNIDEAEKQLEESFPSQYELLDSIKEVLMTCDNLSWEMKQEKVLRLFLYEQFSVLKLE